MTARDEALHAVMKADNNWQFGASPGDYSGGTDYWLTILGAIPPGVLVRLAIEQGALELVPYGVTGPLYRVVEP